jgi:probable rRNA maturation factor
MTQTEDVRRSFYARGWRVDLVRRSGVAVPLPGSVVTRDVARALDSAAAPHPGSVTVVFTDDAELADLNREHMAHRGPTDVLSFPMLEPDVFDRRGLRRRRKGATSKARTHIGDIAISVERAAEQAEQGRGGQTGDVRWSVADELRLLVIHGTLHLCGWDHAQPEEETRMRSLERMLLAR